VPELVVTGIEPAAARVGDPATTLRVRGAGIAPGAVIVFNGGDEPTVVVSDVEATTILDPTTATVATSVPVEVRNLDGATGGPVWFTFLDAGAPLPPMFVTPAEVLERLRKKSTDGDAGYIADCTVAANALVAAELTRGDPALQLVIGPPWPELVWRAALGVAIRIYRFKDAESDVSDTWGDAGALRIPRDPVAGYRDLLAPYLHGSTWAPA
jgi:hypothetical protein